jgi:hypothetical protein
MINIIELRSMNQESRIKKNAFVEQGPLVVYPELNEGQRGPLFFYNLNIKNLYIFDLKFKIENFKLDYFLYLLYI